MLNKLKSCTNGTRHQLNFQKNLLTKKSQICKNTFLGSKKSSARSFSSGHSTTGNRGGGNKKIFRNFSSFYTNNFSIVLCINYDSSRNSFVSLCYNFLTLKFFNVSCVSNTFVGCLISGFKTYPDCFLSSLLSLRNTPPGAVVNSIILAGKTPKYIKSSGAYGVVVQKELDSCKLRLPSGKIKSLSLKNFCSLGSIYNSSKNVHVLGKAGRSRFKGRRPHVRGVAMNPVDHPHGGKTRVGIHSVTPWGLPALNKPTKKK